MDMIKVHLLAKLSLNCNQQLSKVKTSL